MSSNAVSAGRPIARPATRSGSAARLSGGTFAVLLALAGLLIIVATDQVAPATSDRQAQLRIWLAARAAGFTSLLLLAVQVSLGLVLSHPTNKSTWKLSKLLFPWHENAWVFVMAFLAAHIVSIMADEYANVGVLGALVPGLSEYRSSAVALGTLSLYALLVAGVTARYTRLLPSGLWLRLHRLSLVIFALAWLHGVLAGTDSVVASGFYGATGTLVLGAGAYRYWVSRQARPTFSTTLQETSR
jgi:predicted ferric reductase